MNRLFRFIFLSGCLVTALCSCKTYFIPVDSFQQQFAGIDSSRLKEVSVRTPIATTIRYKANPIDSIQCFDSKGRIVYLKNSPSIEIRFTDVSNKKQLFYFDRIFLSDSLVIGFPSRIIGSYRRSIPVNSIKTIEIQDGKKNFHYVKSS